MDLVGHMLVEHLSHHHSQEVHAELVRPGFLPRFTRIAGTRRLGFNADRIMNRMFDYPRHLRKIRSDFDLFHVVDHSYGNLVHALPAASTIVTCHDLDAFRHVLEPGCKPRPLMKAISRRALTGMRQAARVICVSHATRNEILKHRLVPPDRLLTVHNGVHPGLQAQPDPVADAEVARWLGPAMPERIELLHVGGVIPRKRMDVVLEVLAGVRKHLPDVRLVKVGGRLTPVQDRLARQLRIAGALSVLPRLTTAALAAVYRRAALTLLPSSAEGFGLPVIESLACGTPVLASDLDATREVGGETALYCPVGDVPFWIKRTVALLHERANDPSAWAKRRADSIQWASRFSWEHATSLICSTYREVALAAAD